MSKIYINPRASDFNLNALDIMRQAGCRIEKNLEWSFMPKGTHQEPMPEMGYGVNGLPSHFNDDLSAPIGCATRAYYRVFFPNGTQVCMGVSTLWDRQTVDRLWVEQAVKRAA